VLYVVEKPTQSLVDRWGRPTRVREAYVDDGGTHDVRVYAAFSGPVGIGHAIESTVENGDVPAPVELE
jgi:hypothetical protein